MKLVRLVLFLLFHEVSCLAYNFGLQERQASCTSDLFKKIPVILRELRSQGCIFLLNEELKNPRILKITG